VLLLATTTLAADISSSAINTVQDIQAAIDVATAGSTVVIPDKVFDFGTVRLTLKPGVSLRGAGFSKTVFQSSVSVTTGTVCTTAEQDPLLCVAGNLDAANPTIIEGITFNNAAQNAPPILTTTYPGPSMGIRLHTAAVAGERNQQCVTNQPVSCKGTQFVTCACSPDTAHTRVVSCRAC
jgi:hypothetical protein